MPRLMLSDEHWSKLKGMMLQENIYNKRDLRMMVEGMFYPMSSTYLITHKSQPSLAAYRA